MYGLERNNRLFWPSQHRAALHLTPVIVVVHQPIPVRLCSKRTTQIPAMTHSRSGEVQDSTWRRSNLQVCVSELSSTTGVAFPAPDTHPSIHPDIAAELSPRFQKRDRYRRSLSLARLSSLAQLPHSPLATPCPPAPARKAWSWASELGFTRVCVLGRVGDAFVSSR